MEPTSKKTSIVSITIKDENVKRGIDFINALVYCYNDQANIDKNEIAMKTEEFINERLTKIDAELGTTENSLENYKRRNSVTHLEADAAQSLQLSAEYASRLADANTQLQLLDYLQQYVDNSDNRYKIIPANIGMNDQASTQLISDYNRIVQERNRLMRSSSEKSPQVQTLTNTLDSPRPSPRPAIPSSCNAILYKASTPAIRDASAIPLSRNVFSLRLAVSRKYARVCISFFSRNARRTASRSLQQPTRGR